MNTSPENAEPAGDAAARKDRLDAITHEILGAAFAVGSGLGAGFVEKVYENALVHEMRKRGLSVKRQVAFKVRYDGVVVGEFVADLLVEDEVLVELKVVQRFDPVHLAQCLNYLTASGLHLCLLVNFASGHVVWRRVVRDLEEPQGRPRKESPRPDVARDR